MLQQVLDQRLIQSLAGQLFRIFPNESSTAPYFERKFSKTSRNMAFLQVPGSAQYLSMWHLTSKFSGSNLRRNPSEPANAFNSMKGF